MKRWICICLMLVLVLSVCAVSAGANEPVRHTVFTQVLGEGTVIPDTAEVEHNGSIRLYFYPEEGYEVTGVFLNGYPVTFALSLRDHCSSCDGCDRCDWIDWDMLDALLAMDNWEEWKLYVDLNGVCTDKLVTVEFSAKETAEKPQKPADPALSDYADLDPHAWYADAAAYVLKNGLMSGSNGLFDPNGVTSRAMVVTVLWRAEGEPSVRGGSVFDDVDESSWYGKAVYWAHAKGIINGHSETCFAPLEPVTREQLASILWRYAQYKGMDVSVGEDTNILSYDDAFSISEWAFAPLQWACGAGIVNGDNGSLLPKGQASRIQLAAMLQRMLAE